MKRRHFLHRAAGLALMPTLVRQAFAEESPIDRVEALFEAYRRARRAGRPLLVLIVPETRGIHGRAWGELINHGTETQLAPLAIFEPACATPAELAKLAPQANVNADTVLVALDTERVPAAAHNVEAKLASNDYRQGPRSDWTEKSDGIVDSRIASLAEAVHKAAVACQPAKYDPQAGLEVWRPPAPPVASKQVPSAADVERNAGWYWRQLSWDALGAKKAALADVARARFRDERVPGSYWARSTGCGTEIEGGPPSMIGCGMGHINRRSTRFLHFYVKAEDLRRG